MHNQDAYYISRKGDEYYKMKKLPSRTKNTVEFSMCRLGERRVFVTGGGILGNSTCTVEYFDL